MAFIRKRESTEENELTKCTLDDTHKLKPRKIIRRTQGDSPQSNDSRKSIERSREYLPNSYARLARNARQDESVECLTERLAYSSTILTRTNLTPKRETPIEPISEFLSRRDMDLRQRRFQHLQEQLQIRNQQLQLVTQDRKTLRKQNSQLQGRCLYLQQLNKAITIQIQKSKEELRRLAIQKRKLQSQKTSLNKKVEFLQKFNFSAETKTLQSLREHHLEKQIETLKEKLRNNKHQSQHLLEEQLQTMREELFTARKLIESLQINNTCKQRKLQQSSCFIHQDEDYASLRQKYKKFLIEYKQLRKDHENLTKENHTLKSKQQLITSYSEDLSLEFSLFSTLNS